MKKILWSFLEIGETVAIAVAVVFFVRSFIAQPFLVSGSSMFPNFHNGDYLLIDEFTYRFRDPARGEVIVFKYPGDRTHTSYYIKRIVGLPGEMVIVRDGKVKIVKDGKAIDLGEQYVLQQLNASDMEVQLGDGEYFVMGDNRAASYDSRSWGPLARSDVTGLVRLRLWPVDRVMAFSAPEY